MWVQDLPSQIHVYKSGAEIVTIEVNCIDSTFISDDTLLC